MSAFSPTLFGPVVFPDHPAAAAMLVQPVLDEMAGPDAVSTSLAIEYGVGIASGDSVAVEASIIRTTRTLVFVQARLLNASGQMAADFSAIYRRLNPPEGVTDRSG